MKKFQNSNKVYIITGPTASGKSAAAIELALALNAEIISADSMQVYQGLDIGTAKLRPEESQGVVHHLLDIVTVDDFFSVAQYVDLALKAIEDILARGKEVIICGGTGQYIKALLDGIRFFDFKTDAKYEEELEQEILEAGSSSLHQRLVQLDPQAGQKISPNDHKRIVRFFLVLKASGMTRTELNIKSRELPPAYDYQAFAFWPERAGLESKIRARIKLMFEQGLIEETQEILEKYPNFRSSLAGQAIGYKETLAYLAGELNKAECEEKIAISTRQYAKRQKTLLRARADIRKIKTLSETGLI